MSDHAPSDDELISAYLDGEATADEITRVESDPRLQARLDQMGAAVELVAGPVVPPPAAELDRIRGVALDHSSTHDDVIDLRAEAARRGRVRRRLVTAAAAVLVVAVAVPALLAVDGFTDDDSADDVAADAGDATLDETGVSADDGFDLLDDSDAEMGEADTEAAVPTDDPDTALQGDFATADSDAADSDAAEAADPATADSSARAYEDLALLPADLGEFADTVALIQAVTDSLTDYRSAEDDAGSSGDAEPPTALPCRSEILGFLSTVPDPGTALDTGLVTIAGELFTIAVATTDGSTATVALAPHDGCVVTTIDIGD